MTTSNQQLIEILTSAFKYETISMLYWDYTQDAKERGNTEAENIYWIECQVYDNCARGLLDAYEVLTGRKILCIESHIRNEIDALNLAIMENYKSELCPF